MPPQRAQPRRWAPLFEISCSECFASFLRRGEPCVRPAKIPRLPSGANTRTRFASTHLHFAFCVLPFDLLFPAGRTNQSANRKSSRSERDQSPFIGRSR